jgi:hypothetical protein
MNHDPRLETMVEGDRYQVRHTSMGEFTGRCIKVAGGVVTFEVIDGNDRLCDAGYGAGDQVDVVVGYFNAHSLMVGR